MRTLDEPGRAFVGTDRRFFAALVTIFAVVGAALSVIGVYGAVSQLARKRSREMTIRLALGADTAHVRRLAVGHGVRLALIGLGAGGALTWLAAPMIESLLFQTTARDAGTLAVAALLLTGASVAAAWIPARRLSRLDPAAALRSE